MENKVKHTIEKIIHLSYDFRKRGNISSVNLLKESGYLEFFDQITEEEIEEMLKLYPHLVDEWLLWSENKRVIEPVWAFMKFDDGSYLVGGKENVEINTKDEFKACAAFIKLEAEDLRIFLINNPQLL